MPGTLRVTAFSGDINTVGSLTLSPSPSGTIDLMAAGAINGLSSQADHAIVTMINLSDADPSSLPGITTPFGLFPVGVIISNGVATYNPGVNSAARIVDTNNGSNSNGATLVMPFDRLFEESGSTSLTLGQKQALHAPTPVHLNDSVPVHLYAGGDISGIELFSAKTA